MKLIQKAFIEKIRFQLKAAMSFDVIAEHGLKHVKHCFDEKQKESSYFGFIDSPDEDAGPFRNITIKIVDAAEFAEENRDALIESFHAEMVQSWYTFLIDLFSFILSEVRDGNLIYKIPKLEIEVRGDSVASDNLRDEILSAMVKNFDSKKSFEKFNFIKNILKKKTSEFDPELSIVKGEIVLRNLLQHNHGKIRQRDVDMAGVKYFRSRNRNGNIEEYSIGEKIHRTVFDLRNLAAALESISSKLVNAHLMDGDKHSELIDESEF